MSYQAARRWFWQTAKTGAAHLCQGRPVAQGGVHRVNARPRSLWNHTYIHETHGPPRACAGVRLIYKWSIHSAQDTPQLGLHAEITLYMTTNANLEEPGGLNITVAAQSVLDQSDPL